MQSHSRSDSSGSDGATRPSSGGGYTDTATATELQPDHDELEPDDEARKDVYLQVLAVEPPDAVGSSKMSRQILNKAADPLDDSNS